MLSPLNKTNTSSNDSKLTESDIQAIQAQLLEIDKSLRMNFELMRSIQDELKGSSNNTVENSKENTERSKLIKNYLSDEYIESKQLRKKEISYVTTAALIVGIAAISTALIQILTTLYRP
jgi:signal recognition particle GTPase